MGTLAQKSLLQKKYVKYVRGKKATWQPGNLATWQPGNLATWQPGNLSTKIIITEKNM
jgi:hypothetical protein